MERLPRVMPPLDQDWTHRVAQSRRGNGGGAAPGGKRHCDRGRPVTAVVLDSGERIEAGLVILAVGVAESFSVITGALMWRPLESTGNALRGSAPLMTPAELIAWRAAGEAIQVVDVRSARDVEKSHVDSAIHSGGNKNYRAYRVSHAGPR